MCRGKICHKNSLKKFLEKEEAKVYFKSAGPENTQKTIELAVKTAHERGINYIVVASCSGKTAKLLENCGKNVVVVTHVNGFAEPGKMEIDEKTIEELKAKGFKVYTGTHVYRVQKEEYQENLEVCIPSR